MTLNKVANRPPNYYPARDNRVSSDTITG